MATTVTYKGQTLATVENQTKTLQTAGTWVEDDFTLTDVSGGGGGTELVDFIARTATTFENSDVITVGHGVFRDWVALTSISLPNCTTFNGFVFNGDNRITNFHFPNLTTMTGSQVFGNAGTTTSTMVLPKIQTLPSINAISSFNGVAVDLGESLPSIPGYCFGGSTNMNILILRGSTLKGLNSINAFGNTPFASGKAGGTLYVPSALISSYQSATNWSTILGYSTNSIQAIEGSIYETHYADGTVIS